jgi:hypothetical protein
LKRSQNCGIIEKRKAVDLMSNKIICPVCGKTEFQKECDYDICKYCGWENDDCFEEGGANTLSLIDYRNRYHIYVYLNPKYIWKIHGYPELTVKDYCTYWHQYSISNKKNILLSNKCGCFFCQKTFDSKLISEHYINDNNGETAVCPLCGVELFCLTM